MGKEQKMERSLELVIQRKGRTIYARLRGDREFNADEIAGAAPFAGKFSSLEAVRQELQELMAAGNFKIVVPASSELAPEQTQVVIFGDMTGAPPVRAMAERPKMKTAAGGRSSKTEKGSPVVAPSAPEAVPVPAVAPTPKGATATAAAAPVAGDNSELSKSRKRAVSAVNSDEKAFQAFIKEWKTKYGIQRLSQKELADLRHGEWPEVREQFIAKKAGNPS